MITDAILGDLMTPMIFGNAFGLTVISWKKKAPHSLAQSSVCGRAATFSEAFTLKASALDRAVLFVFLG